MLLHRLLSGSGLSRVLRAPENDEGEDFDLDIDTTLDDEDDEPGDDLDDEDDPEDAEAEPRQVNGQADDDEEPVRKPSRATARVETALKEAREARERAEAAEARATAAERAAQSRQANEDAATERQRLEMMSEGERLQYLLDKNQRTNDARFQQMQFETNDRYDKAAFDSLAARNPTAQKLAGEVETRLQEMRRAGTTAPRETILRYIIGDKALANANRAKGKQTKRTAEARARQTTRPSSGRSDISSRSEGRGDTVSARNKRLENMEL